MSRAFLITPGVTYVDDTRPKATPALGSLPELLDRVSAAFTDGTGVVLLDRTVSGSLGLPVDELPTGKDAQQHVAAITARAAGWKARSVHRWTRFERGRSAVSVGLLGHIEPAVCPLVGPFPTDTAASFAAWHELTGVAWFGSPGDAGNAVLKATQPEKYEAKGKPAATWWPWRQSPAEDPIEWAMTPESWRRPNDFEYEHLYDVTRSYLAALRNVEVARWQLKPTGRIEFTPKLAGWWKVELSPWVIELMPAPWGPDVPGEDGRVRWLTTPTVKLLMELTEQQVYGGVRVLDSWTAPADRSVMSGCADRLNQAFQAAVTLPDPGDAERVGTAVKDAYTWMYSSWRYDGSEVQRHDWSAAPIAEARCNLWRRMWAAAGQGPSRHKAKPGAARWPLRVATDGVWYGSDNPDPWADPPAGFKLVPKGPDGKPAGEGELGTFKPKKTNRKRATV